jgi:hypothetical protein
MTNTADLDPCRSALDGLEDNSLTHVELTWIANKIEFWVRFGSVDREEILDRRRRILSFRPGTAFAFVRWAANDFGTVTSRLDIVRTIARSQAYQTLPYVRPGGEILFTLQGRHRDERVLQMIDAIERLGIDPQAVSQDHWRHVHNRITAGQEPRTYTLGRHRASLLRRRVQP